MKLEWQKPEVVEINEVGLGVTSYGSADTQPRPVVIPKAAGAFHRELSVRTAELPALNLVTVDRHVGLRLPVHA